MEEVPKFIEDGMEELEQLLIQMRIAMYRQNITRRDHDRIQAIARAEPERWFPDFYGGGVIAYDSEGNVYWASNGFGQDSGKIRVGRCAVEIGRGPVVELAERELPEIPGSWEFYGQDEIQRIRRDDSYDWQPRRFITAWEKQVGLK